MATERDSCSMHAPVTQARPITHGSLGLNNTWQPIQTAIWTHSGPMRVALATATSNGSLILASLWLRPRASASLCTLSRLPAGPLPSAGASPPSMLATCSTAAGAPPPFASSFCGAAAAAEEACIMPARMGQLSPHVYRAVSAQAEKLLVAAIGVGAASWMAVTESAWQSENQQRRRRLGTSSSACFRVKEETSSHRVRTPSAACCASAGATDIVCVCVCSGRGGDGTGWIPICLELEKHPRFICYSDCYTQGLSRLTLFLVEVRAVSRSK
eukprot:scaffold65453_cov36-Tisochrysis_lutea.AAC.1